MSTNERGAPLHRRRIVRSVAGIGIAASVFVLAALAAHAQQGPRRGGGMGANLNRSGGSRPAGGMGANLNRGRASQPRGGMGGNLNRAGGGMAANLGGGGRASSKPRPIREEFYPVAGEAEQRIYTELTNNTECEFVDTPLGDVAAYLSALHDIQVKIDATSVEAASQSTDSPVTMEVRQVPLEDALHHILDPLGLTWKVDHSVLSIVGQIEDSTDLTTRVYPVQDLLAANQSAQSIAQAVTESIEADSWTTSGGAGHVMALGDNLLVTQCFAVHQRILGVLRALRRAAKDDT